ncbi:hypothetical protein JX265_010696 [Neoarthrinium moseri]|uniref:Uncharacterized protein n=1 Tax=Neoarthrinium moseri TaxID=1658444 RepID=A0A9Q0ALG7_9PEZI|nr:uncharacterized protein JN550_007210 [Neoarthrinium moseri]KAI1846577.1 hypothetical protein JX266_007474 [Neoarthrinium moseri]KAI1858603.1 hypothetical protein JX265_010696 [Neoarthrinium moseri]KAI1867158.1 hypothetical protein JN550_007210 [Neoarthrinium moseri]
MGGVAAKAVGVHYTGRPVVRKSLRARQRNSMPKPLKIPAKVPEEAQSKSAPLVMSHQINCVPPSCPLRLPVLPMPETVKALDLDTDTETEVGIPLEDVDRDEAKMAPTPPSLTDFSNYLGISIMDEVCDDSSVTLAGSETYSRVQSVDDLYGWEAELTRKVSCGIAATNACHCDSFDYRRANGHKRSLLHRVFSIPSSRRT